MIRFRFYFSGRVQGVGFRFTARSLAVPMGLTGFVQNLSDGRVLMEAQGSQSNIDTVISRLVSGDSYIRITNIEKEEIPIVQGEKAFDYRF